MGDLANAGLFTFQYGSILIFYMQKGLLPLDIFTFQYGSILIKFNLILGRECN
mgnify:CR=1 FL=1